MSTAAPVTPPRDYGARILAVEPGGVELIGSAERHGRPLDLLWMWLTPNLEFATMFVGVVAALFGAGFWLTVLGLVLGTVAGAVIHGILATTGPRLGAAQMVAGRLAFGRRGALLPAGLNALTSGAGWVAVNSVSGAFALQSLAGAMHLPTPSFAIALLSVVAVEAAVALAGHNLIHAVQRWLAPLLLVAFTAATLVVLGRATPSDAPSPEHWAGPFLLTVFAAFAYAASWHPYASDYSRYLRATASPQRVGLFAGLGIAIPCLLLEIGGAALVTVPGTHWSANDVPTDQLAAVVSGPLGIAVLVAICLGAISANVLNLYSGAMSLLVLRPGATLRRRRAGLAAVLAGVGLVIGLSGAANPGSTYETFLFLNTYWILPWVTIVLIDLWQRRRRPASAADLAVGVPSGPAVIAMVAGILAALPFMNQPLFTGVVAARWPDTGDLSLFVTPALTAAVYLVLRRHNGRTSDESESSDVKSVEVWRRGT